MHENREIPDSPSENGTGGRVGKVVDRNPTMYGSGKSDRSIVPMKQPNKPDNHGAEAVEGRGLAKENTDQQNTSRTQCRTKYLGLKK